MEISQGDFGVSYKDRLDIWQRCIYRILQDIDPSFDVKVEKYNEDASYKYEKERIKIVITKD